MKNRKKHNRVVRLRSYNPYYIRFPITRVVSRETLMLIKTLRIQGINVVVEPEDGTKLHYLSEKGISELISDPVIAFLVGIPVSFFINLISSWIYDLLKNYKGKKEIDFVVEVNEDGQRLHYKHTGEQISDERFKTLLSKMDRKSKEYGLSLITLPPHPNLSVPIYLEHTGKIVAWGEKTILPPNVKTRK